MSSNILNTWDVDRFVDAIEVPNDNPAIAGWLRSVARRWILREFPAAGRVMAIRPADDDGGQGEVDLAWGPDADSVGTTTRTSPIPPWLSGALAGGVYWLELDGPSADRLALSLSEVVRYFDSVAGDRDLGRLTRMALPDAVRAAMRFRANRVKRRDDPENTLMTFGNGFRIALLSTPEEYLREGAEMRHCLGSYARRIDPNQDILSLRDSRDRPHATIELLGGRKVFQVKGKANGPIAPRYRGYVQGFIDAMHLQVVGDLRNAGLTHRSFALDASRGWRAQESLRQLVQRDLKTGCDVEEMVELARLCDDVTVASRTGMPDEDWDWFIGLFRGPGGRLVWQDRAVRLQVGDRAFGLGRLCFPYRLYELLRDLDDSRSRDLRRHLQDQLTDYLVRFCRTDDSRLLDVSFYAGLSCLDLRRMRHLHKDRLRRGLASARRGMRQRARTVADPYAALDRWERDRLRFAEMLDDPLHQYL